MGEIIIFPPVLFKHDFYAWGQGYSWDVLTCKRQMTNYFLKGEVVSRCGSFSRQTNTFLWKSELMYNLMQKS